MKLWVDLYWIFIMHEVIVPSITPFSFDIQVSITLKRKMNTEYLGFIFRFEVGRNILIRVDTISQSLFMHRNTL